MVFARIVLNDYANRVLNVIKAKFNLKDKSEAINKFVEMYGDEIIEKDVNDDYLKKILDLEKKHIEKYGHKTMTFDELDHLCDLNQV